MANCYSYRQLRHVVGYNYQGVNGNNYSGFYGGLSIPLWSSKNKVKAAQANYEYQQSNTQVITTSLYSQFQETFSRYQLMLSKFNEYQSTMDNLESEDLLFKAYMLGEYSFMDYYVELQFYRNASDKMLKMEKELQLLDLTEFDIGNVLKVVPTSICAERMRNHKIRFIKS